MAKNQSYDIYILKLLKQNPEQGMALVVEQYTALLWKVISAHLNNPEDIKECTNDTFAEFYFHRDCFDLQKSSLAVYLSAIARNQAVSRYRKERNHSVESPIMDIAVEDNGIALAELRSDLDQAMSSLKPNELQIIRMKYYNGMTVQEIADSLNLPYETVKKRHQRSIGKLRRAMLLTLLILLLGLVTACTYKILVYYQIIPDFWTEFWNGDLPDTSGVGMDENTPIDGLRRAVPLELPAQEANETPAEVQIVVSPAESAPASETTPDEYSSFTVIPGYGINTSSGLPVYTLYEASHAENSFVDVSLDYAFYINDVLNIRLTVNSKDALSDPSNYHIPGSSDTVWCDTMNWARSRGSTYIQMSRAFIKKELVFTVPDLPEPEDGRLNMLLKTSYGLSIPFVLISAVEKSLDNYAYQTGEHGGLLVIPRLENGSLIVAIYPLNANDDYGIVPWLVQSQYAHSETGTITVTGSDGSTLTGTRIASAYRDANLYYEWDFGPAVPGTYTLHVPFLYQMTDSPEDFGISLNLKELTWEDKIYPIPGGSICVESCTPLETPSSSLPNPNTYWNLRLHYESEDASRPVADFYFKQQAIPLSYILDGGDPADYNYDKWNFSSINIIAIDEKSRMVDITVSLDESKYDASYVYLSFQTETMLAHSINYRWNQSFDLSFTVE